MCPKYSVAIFFKFFFTTFYWSAELVLLDFYSRSIDAQLIAKLNCL
jgi:hypothetical protein